jgi:hypothetical protein
MLRSRSHPHNIPRTTGRTEVGLEKKASRTDQASKSLRNTPYDQREIIKKAAQAHQLKAVCLAVSLVEQIAGEFSRGEQSETLCQDGHEMSIITAPSSAVIGDGECCMLPPERNRKGARIVAIPLTTRTRSRKDWPNRSRASKKGSHARTRAGADDVLQKVRQIDTAASITDWLNSPALQSQK